MGEVNTSPVTLKLRYGVNRAFTMQDKSPPLEVPFYLRGITLDIAPRNNVTPGGDDTRYDFRLSTLSRQDYPGAYIQ